MDLMFCQLLFGFEPVGGNCWQPQRGQFLQVMLVRVPVEHVSGILHATQLLRPFQERGTILRVIGYGANNDHAGIGPINVGIIPYLDLRVASARRQLVKQALLAGEEIRHGLTGHQGYFRVGRHLFPLGSVLGIDEAGASSLDTH